jgi:hypothetical protein
VLHLQDYNKNSAKFTGAIKAPWKELWRLPSRSQNTILENRMWYRSAIHSCLHQFASGHRAFRIWYACASDATTFQAPFIHPDSGLTPLYSHIPTTVSSFMTSTKWSVTEVLHYRDNVKVKLSPRFNWAPCH